MNNLTWKVLLAWPFIIALALILPIVAVFSDEIADSINNLGE